MTSNVEICNVALVAVDRQVITDLLDGSDSGNACNAIFVPTRQELIRGHDWNFARARVKLAQLTGTPVTEFTYAYQLPADWLRTIIVSDNDNADPRTNYRMEGDQILSSATDLYLTYIRDITDASKLPADFRAYFSYEIASRLARTTVVREEMRRERDRLTRVAKSTDSIEDAPDRRPQGSWVSRRFSSSFSFR